jgi:hypothetical protein
MKMPTVTIKLLTTTAYVLLALFLGYQLKIGALYLLHGHIEQTCSTYTDAHQIGQVEPLSTADSLTKCFWLFKTDQHSL